MPHPNRTDNRLHTFLLTTLLCLTLFVIAAPGGSGLERSESGLPAAGAAASSPDA